MHSVDPVINLLVVVIIGVVAGVLYDRLVGPGWLGRQIAGSRRGALTATLVGIAGSFIGFHAASLLGTAFGGIGLYLGAALGAALILWIWRVIK